MPRNNVNPNKDYIILQLEQYVTADDRADAAQDTLDATIAMRDKTLSDNAARLAALQAEIAQQNADAEQLVVDRTVDARVAEELAKNARDWLVAVIREDRGDMVDPIPDSAEPVNAPVVVTEPMQPGVNFPTTPAVDTTASVATDGSVATEPVVSGNTDENASL
ncbi:MAG: hypothetical protein B7Z37_26585 [Verrucomicrobia bacterium 12-59-8]|nr:MAG: hypothetical protein B7Z37_26585 [Verrucomicrobia bacterium 12-59-8]